MSSICGEKLNWRSGGEVFRMSWKPHFLELRSILYLGLCLSEMTNDCIAVLGMCCSLSVLPDLELLVSKVSLFFFLQKTLQHFNMLRKVIFFFQICEINLAFLLSSCHTYFRSSVYQGRGRCLWTAQARLHSQKTSMKRLNICLPPPKCPWRKTGTRWRWK